MMTGESYPPFTDARRTILVTGGAGFVGSWLTRRLRREGHRVVVYDLTSPQTSRHADDRSDDSIRYVVGDIRDRELVEAVLHDERVETIFHLAARVGVRHADEEAEEYRSVNVDGTACVLQAAVRRGRIPLFFASSSSVYGPRTSLPMAEADRLDPISHYGRTKREGERLCMIARREHNLDVRIGRYFTVYGPNGRPDMAIPRLLRAVRTGDAFTMAGDGAARRDWTYVDDTIEGTIRLMGGTHPIELMNIGTGRSTSLRHVIELIEKLQGATITLSNRPRHRFDLDETRADLSRAETTGYRTRYPIESGLLRCLNSPHFPTTAERIRQTVTHKGL